MPFPRAKSSRQLYDEVKSYDRVITPDGPLASALNRQLDRSHLGPFAIPPRRLAVGRRQESEDRLAFLGMIENEDISWKRCAYAVGNILQCWEHQGSHEAIFEYDAYIDEATERAVERIGDLETASMKLTNDTIDSDLDVVVVEPEMLTQLERAYLPTEYDTVSLFADTEFELPPFRIHDSPTAIIETVVNAVTETNAENVGIVLDQESEYSPLIESALEAADIPFFGGPGFTDRSEHRLFLHLLRTAHRGTDTRISEIRSLLTAFDCDVADREADKRLHELGDDNLSWLIDFCHEIQEYTFSDALSVFEHRTDDTLDAFRTELDELGIAEEPVTEARLDEVSFYLQTYEVPVERDNEGVLLADAKSASYVGREVVFYLGLDDRWTHSAPRRPWVDQDAQFTRNLKSFQLLLQSGSQQHYLVQDATGGSPVTPCLYFEELLEQEYDRFSKLPSSTHQLRSKPHDGAVFNTESVDVSPDPVETISKSSLNTYVNSPRDYCFSRIVDGPEKEYLTEGNLFHDFAEFYVNYPTVVDDAALTDVVDLMLDEVRPLIRSVDEQTRRTEYRVSLETIVSYLDDNPPTDGAFLTPSSSTENAIADYFGYDIKSPVTERRFVDEDLGINGMIDLVQSQTELLDYKSGSENDANSIVQDAAIDELSDEPDFQALLYLTYWRSQMPAQQLSFTFFYVTELVDDAIAGDVDIEDALTTVTYYPGSLTEHVRTEEFFEYLREEGANKCQKILSKIDYQTYAALFDAAPLVETADSDELIESEFGRTMIERLEAEIGEYKYVTTGSKQAMREIARQQKGAFFEPDLDAFESFVEERLTELNRRRTGDEPFPIEGLAGEPNYRRVDNRDLLLEGEQ
ncbi:PD-(D/E)XK nuclease family protein [Halorubrum ezzemoulense]|uniref:PD-(D/E)XK nuclease family protein n=1 Tax=Halorubrum ezzemoulense TaxID=337243 RepID=UPI002330BD65|nr:PD-(D/E)XK nuclease family protein [Halorubrum ezzemoulense]MDB2239192.1 PD-(D/E)XK nuclease family protein [Halorubrum ezzemoulense]